VTVSKDVSFPFGLPKVWEAGWRTGSRVHMYEAEPALTLVDSVIQLIFLFWGGENRFPQNREDSIFQIVYDASKVCTV